MRIPLFAICAALAFMISCVTDDALYLPGELPGFGVAGSRDMDCQLEVDADAPAGATDPSHTPAAVAADRRTHRAGDSGDVGFTTPFCDAWVTD